jgi:glucitol/sorbitol PTS system EIIB component
MLAVFDFLVCICAVFGFLRSRRGGVVDIVAPTGFLLIATAALIGTVRYAWLPHITGLHQAVSLAASVYGVPAVAVGFFLAAEEIRRRRYYELASLLLIVLALALYHLPLFALLIGIVAQAIWILAAVRFQRIYEGIPIPIVISVFCVSTAGLVFANPGATLAIRHENWFHGLLAIGLVQQGLAFARLKPRA